LDIIKAEFKSCISENSCIKKAENSSCVSAVKGSNLHLENQQFFHTITQHSHFRCPLYSEMTVSSNWTWSGFMISFQFKFENLNDLFILACFVP